MWLRSLLLKYQLVISSRAQRRAPNLNSFDRFVLALEFCERGKSKRAPRIEIMIKRVGAAALKGDPSAAAMLLEMRARLAKHGDINPIIIRMSEADMKAA